MENVDKAADAVNAFCTPEKMSKSAAVEFLGAVIDRLQSSIEALNEEMDEG